MRMLVPVLFMLLLTGLCSSSSQSSSSSSSSSSSDEQPEHSSSSSSSSSDEQPEHSSSSSSSWEQPEHSSSSSSSFSPSLSPVELAELVLVSTPLPWVRARSYCRQHHTDLASFSGPDQLLHLPSPPDPGTSTLAWIRPHRVWAWSDGKSLQQFNSWASGSPAGDGGEDCVEMRRDGTWNAQMCNQSLPFICYGNRTRSITHHVLVTVDDWDYFYEAGRTPWSKAQTYCRTHHLDLARLRDQGDSLKLIQHIAQSSTTPVWIGLSRVWVWPDNSSPAHRAWQQGQPRPHHCSATQLQPPRQWQTQECEKNLPFICFDDGLLLVRDNRSWGDAMAFCRARGRDLVSIPTAGLAERVRVLARSASSPHVWLGLLYQRTLGIWFWLSGETVCHQDWSSGHGQREGPQGEDAAAVPRGQQQGGQQQWVSLHQHTHLNFICSK